MTKENEQKVRKAVRNILDFTDCTTQELQDKLTEGISMILEKDDIIDRQAAEIEGLTKQLMELKKGENSWWQKRWVKSDMGKQLFKIRKKWLMAYECAENYQKMYEQLQAELDKYKKDDK